MNRDTNKVTFKKAVQYNLRAFKLLYRQCPSYFIAIAASGICKSVTPYVGIYLSAQIINELAGNRRPDMLRHWVLITVITTAVLALLTNCLKRYEEYRRDGYMYKMNFPLSKKAMEMDFCSIDDQHTFDLLAQIRQHSMANSWGLRKVLYYYEMQLIPGLANVAAAAILCVSLFTSRVPESSGAFTIMNHPVFALLIIGTLLVITIVSPIFNNKGNSYWAVYANEGAFRNRFFAFFGFSSNEPERALDMRIYNQQNIFDRVFHRSYIGDSLDKYARGPMGGYYALSAAVSALFTGVVYLFVCVKAWAGAFGIGSATQYIGALTALTQGVSALLSFGEMYSNCTFLDTLFEYLDTPNTMYQGSLTTEKRRDKHYEVEFRDVSFKYPHTDTYALRHVSVKFEVGKKLAVVGMNGSGKTTFIKLLCRLYDPTEGEILLNGIDIRKYDYHDYMDIFSVVFQDYKLLPFSIGENVAASSDYDEAKVTACLEKAGFKERLASLPKGLDTSLYKQLDSEGVEVSGGEAQKLAIARALYKDSAFIILDEPTAALDPIAEAEIYSKFNEIAGDKTAIYISHRLSSCRFCDNILVFHEGNIVEQGSHEMLVANTKGKYHELWNAQAQYYA